MKLRSGKKKELWRYASKTNTATCEGIPTQSLQPPRLQPPRRPQTPAYPSATPPFGSIYVDNTATRQLATPPPPYYSSMSCVSDCSFSNCQQLQNQQREHQLVYHLRGEVEVSGSSSGMEESDNGCLTPPLVYTKGGCNCASSGDDMLPADNEVCPPPAATPIHNHSCHVPPPVASASRSPSPMSAALAMFRNCCGGTTSSSSASEPSTGSFVNSMRQSSSRHWPTTHAATNGAPTASPMRKLTQDFDAFTRQLKHKQLSELLRAIKSREPPPSSTSAKSNAAAVNVCPSSATPSYLQCILIKCNSNAADQEQQVTACRLFFWSDIRNASELRRLPICPSARDCIYVCCNPLHWCRIIQPIDPETVPPPYQRSKMQRLRDADSEENSQNIIIKSSAGWSAQSSSHNSQSHSSTSIVKRTPSEDYVPSLESFTTNGEDRSACSKIWCQIAYWELAERVGEFFHAKKPVVNIYADGPVDYAGIDSMCLRDLAANRPVNADSVQNTRQKIGLGIMLSLDCNNVWLYNRGNVAIFVYSPTLSERLDRVCKVMPGCCLKAFDTHRAQILACHQSRDHQLGPIDRFSIKISFAKGWGHTYRRQDIMGCPCWLEVHFSQLR